MLNIKGVNKVKLLHALHDHAMLRTNLEVMFERGKVGNPIPSPPFDTFMAPQAVTGPIETYCGYFIGCDLSGDTVNPGRFDSQYGSGAFKRVLALQYLW